MQSIDITGKPGLIGLCTGIFHKRGPHRDTCCLGFVTNRETARGYRTGSNRRDAYGNPYSDYGFHDTWQVSGLVWKEYVCLRQRTASASKTSV